jgi:DNA-directed RNA polymerase subunit omega
VARITVEDCLHKVPNRFALVMLVAKRAKQLIKGDESTVTDRDNKFIVTALREVSRGTARFAEEGTIDYMDEIEKDLNR